MSIFVIIRDSGNYDPYEVVGVFTNRDQAIQQAQEALNQDHERLGDVEIQCPECEGDGRVDHPRGWLSGQTTKCPECGGRCTVWRINDDA